MKIHHIVISILCGLLLGWSLKIGQTSPMITSLGIGATVNNICSIVTQNIEDQSQVKLRCNSENNPQILLGDNFICGPSAQVNAEGIVNTTIYYQNTQHAPNIGECWLKDSVDQLTIQNSLITFRF